MHFSMLGCLLLIIYIDACANSIAGRRVWLVASCLGSSITCFDVSTDTYRNQGLNTPSIRLFRLHVMYWLSVLHIRCMLACTSDIHVMCYIHASVAHVLMYCYHDVLLPCCMLSYDYVPCSMLSYALRYAYIMMICSHAILARCIITCHVDAHILL